MSKNKKCFKLFAYGTLANRDYFQIITGKDLPRRSATLPNFARVVELRAFPYIVPRAGASTDGVLIEGIDANVLAHLDHYEANGRLYTRRPVLVVAGAEETVAFTYVGNPEQIAAHFGFDLDESDRVEQHLDEEIDAVLARSTTPQGEEDAALEVRARRELMGDTVAALVRAHFQNPSWSPYIVRYSLERSSLPSLAWLRDCPEAQRYAGNYLRFLARLVAFNQIEERVRADFRPAVRVVDPYYHHTISALIAFTFLNRRAAALLAGIRRQGLDRYDPGREYLDYAREALLLAQSLYDRDTVAAIVQRVNSCRRIGATPMGAELEFSYLGMHAVNAAPGADPVFDSFYYFHDFDLARRLWKMGGYVDDHTGVMFDEGRSRGFLEVAFGRMRVGADLSRPATQDSWILAELIQQATRFIGIPTHSLHLSLQADAERPFTRLEHPEFLKCLLALGGDLSPDAKGVLREQRIFRKETMSPYTGLEFSRLNSHRAEEGDARATAVVEFTFPRLSARRYYEPLILALKGFQWANNPMPLDLTAKCPYRAYHREVAAELVRWARNPQALSSSETGAFLEEVERGLYREAAAADAAVSADAIEAGLQRIERLLRRRNRLIRESGNPRQPIRGNPKQNR